jgi:hypothetical protein
MELTRTRPSGGHHVVGCSCRHGRCHHLRRFALVGRRDPRSAFESVLRWRELKPAREVRAEWASRIFDYRTSVAVGTGLTQNIINSTIGGPVQQYIHATP